MSLFQAKKIRLFGLLLLIGGAFLFSLEAKAQSPCLDSFSVAPLNSNDDNLMGNTNASWRFSFDNTTSTPTGLNAGDKVKVTFPTISQGRPFILNPNVMNATSTSIVISTSPALEGQNTVVFTLTQNQNAGGQFTITLNGVENPIAPLANLQNISWSALTTDASNNDAPRGESVSATATITRLGQMIPYDQNFELTSSDYSTSATADYTLSFTAPTALSPGQKIVWQFPSEFDLSSATIDGLSDLTLQNASTSPQVTTIEKITTGGSNLVRFPISSGSSSANDVLTITLKGVVNPSSKDAYRGFGVYTTTADNGVIDGLPVEAGIEPNRKGPPLLDSVMIGGTNTINFTVKKELTDGTIVNLSASETALIKVGLACPDKMFFVGERYLKTDSTATFEALLDCNYIAFTMPAQEPGAGQTPDEDFKTFYENYLEPGMMEIPASGGGTYNITPTFVIPDTYITGTVTGGPANGTGVDVMAFDGTHQSWGPVTSDTTYDYDKMGLNSNGTGYFRLKVRSGSTWKVNLILHETGGVISDAQGNEYWAPDLGSVYIPAGDTTTKDLGTKSFVKADKLLTVNLINSATGNPINDACVSVGRGGMDFMMMREPDCTGPYQFKVPTGPLSIEVMQPGMGKPKSFPITIKSTDTSVTKSIVLSAPTSYISGTVTDSDGNVIQNASVFAHGSHGFGQDMTDSSGQYRIYVPPGTYRVEGFTPGFGPLTAQTVVVTDTTNPTVNFTVNTTGYKTISGRVYTDSDSSGDYSAGDTVYEGVQIFAFGPAGENGTTTLSDGTYVLRVPAGVYSVEGWSETTGRLPVQTGIDVSSSNQSNVNWQVPSLATLQITITGAKDVSPIFAEAINPVTGRSNHIHQWQVSGNDKVGTMYLPAGATYEIHVSSPAFGEITPAQSSVTVPLSGASVSYSLPNVATLTGKVTSGGSGIEGAMVWAANIGGPGYFSTTTDSSGNYSMVLPTGRNYDLGVNIPGYLAATKTITNFSGSAPAQNFTLTESGATISGKITSDGTTGISEAWVWAEKVGASGWTAAPAQDDGTYSLDVDSGTWKVFADAPCYEKSEGVQASAGETSVNITLKAISGCVPPKPNIQTIVPATGGTVYNDADGDGSPDIEIYFPAGALGTGTTPVTVSIKQNPDVVSTQSASPLANATQEITITASDGSQITTLNTNATLTIYYKESDLPEGFDESDLRLSRWNSSTNNWEPVASTVDTTNNKITASIDHFSPYGPDLGGVPSAPEGLSASASENTISLSWNEVANATSYTVYRALSEDGTYSSIGTTTDTSYTDSGLAFSTTYYYKVSGSNDNGEGPKSSAVSATTETASGGGGYIPPQKECSDYTTENECENEGCYWYGGACHEKAPTCSDYTTEQECLDADCYWYEGACHSEEKEIEKETPKKPIEEMTIEELQAEIMKIQKQIIELLKKLIATLQEQINQLLESH